MKSNRNKLSSKCQLVGASKCFQVLEAAKAGSHRVHRRCAKGKDAAISVTG
ncbi:hypothetical protein A2U01_0063855, partial [Trifolium medium]|nr:hypothetical protein [Trifolium medium]